MEEVATLIGPSICRKPLPRIYFHTSLLAGQPTPYKQLSPLSSMSVGAKNCFLCNTLDGSQRVCRS